MAARGKSFTCPECEAFVYANQPTCGECGWVNDRAGKHSTRCQMSLGDLHCPLPATVDRRWCGWHMDPIQRDATDGVRRQLETMLAEPGKFIGRSFHARGKDRMCDQRVREEWHRIDGESRSEYAKRMSGIAASLRGLPSGAKRFTPEDRARIQREAAENRIPAIRVHDIADVTDQFEVELERLIAQGLSHEQAAGLAFEATLEARLKA